VQLPAVFGGRFELVRELRHGGEGFVMVVRELDGGGLWVLKGYHHGFDLDMSSLEVLSGPDVDLDHVVRVIEFGELPDGTFYEIQEFCVAGSLREALDRGDRTDFETVASELASALGHVHALGIVHRDVKPENLLVRSLNPLDLVLTDFGLVRQMGGSVRRTTRAGTAEYSPPEGVATQVEISPAWDWWSLGMVLAELAAGAHPLALPDGSFPSADEMRSELAQRPVDLDGVADPRQRLLCAGLLVRDRRRRWGATEVAEWLAGGSPGVADSHPAPDLDGLPRSSDKTVLFRTQDIADPAALAAAFQAHSSEAMERLFQDPDPALVEETIALCLSTGRDEAAGLLRERPTGDDLARHFARLLVAIDAQLAPMFNGIDLTPAGLEAAARAAIEQGEQQVGSKLETVRRAQILRVWRHLPGMESAASIYAAWSEMHIELERVLSMPGVSLVESEAHQASAYLLLAAIDTRHLDDLNRRLESLDMSQTGAGWWETLRDDGRTAATAIAVLTYPRAVAENQQRQEDERQQQRLAAAQAAADQERAQRAQRNAAQERQRQRDAERRAGRARTFRTLRGRWLGYLLWGGLAWVIGSLAAGGGTYRTPRGPADDPAYHFADAFSALGVLTLMFGGLAVGIDLLLARQFKVTSRIWPEITGGVIGLTLWFNSAKELPVPESAWVWFPLMLTVSHGINALVEYGQDS